MTEVISSVAVQLESQALNSIVSAFSFASVLAWYAVVKNLIELLVKAGKDGIKHNVIAAVVTTLLAILVFLVTKTVARNVKINEPGQPVFAVTR